LIVKKARIIKTREFTIFLINNMLTHRNEASGDENRYFLQLSRRFGKYLNQKREFIYFVELCNMWRNSYRGTKGVQD